MSDIEIDQAYEVINETLQECCTPPDEPDAVLTGWCLVAEFMDGDGEKWVSTWVPDHVSNWQARGFFDEGGRKLRHDMILSEVTDD